MQTILLTGCSTGIGFESSLLLARRGWRVFASMRDLKRAAALKVAAKGLPLEILKLDVTRPADVRRAVRHVLRRAKRLDALVNNAGYGLYGASDEFTDEECRSQFDTNLYGLHRLTRECLPVMRRQGSGRIVQVGSLAGRMTFAGLGLYSATKYAVEAYTEALRLEVGRFGIQATVVEPGQIKTPFKQNQVMARAVQTGRSAHQEAMELSFKASSQRADNAPGPEVVADTVFRALSVPSMKVRYPVGLDSVCYPRIRWFLPDALWDFVVTKMYGRYVKGVVGSRLPVGGASRLGRLLTTDHRPPSPDRICEPGKKVVLVTGATSGIGLACAVELASHGWKVYAGYRNPKKLTNLKQASNGRDIFPILLDTDRTATVDKAVAWIDKHEGRLDAVVNNAGFVVAGCWEEVSDDDLSAQMETNVFGCLRVARAAARIMRRQGSGRIVNITSVSAFISTPVMGAYAASKFALSALTQTLRLELAPFGIQVGEVAPGFIQTGIVGAVRRSDRPGRPTPYADFYRKIEEHISREVRKAPPASKVAWLVRYALQVPHMEERYLVKPSDKMLAFIKWALPDSWREKVMAISLGL